MSNTLGSAILFSIYGNMTDEQREEFRRGTLASVNFAAQLASHYAGMYAGMIEAVSEMTRNATQAREGLRQTFAKEAAALKSIDALGSLASQVRAFVCDGQHIAAQAMLRDFIKGEVECQTEQITELETIA